MQGIFIISQSCLIKSFGCKWPGALASCFHFQLHHQTHLADNGQQHLPYTYNIADVAHLVISNGTAASFKSHTSMGRFSAGDDASAVYIAAERLTSPAATPLVGPAGLTRPATQPIKVVSGAGIVSAHLHETLKELGHRATCP